MPLIQLASGSLHYVDTGDGMPVVLLHANPGDSLDFQAVIPRLAERYRVIAPDWPGYGASEPPPEGAVVDAGFYYRVLRELLDVLPLPPAIFIGNSLGGNVAARLAIESPGSVRGLVLVAPGGFTERSFVSRSFCKLMSSRWSLSPRRFAGLYLRHRTPTVQRMLERAATTQASKECLAINRSVWRGFMDPEHDLRVKSRAIVAPTLLIFGAGDPVISAKKDGETAAQAMPHAQFVVLPSGHAPFAEVPQMFLHELLPFLAACTDERVEAAV